MDPITICMSISTESLHAFHKQPQPPPNPQLHKEGRRITKYWRPKKKCNALEYSHQRVPFNFYKCTQEYLNAQYEQISLPRRTKELTYRNKQIISHKGENFCLFTSHRTRAVLPSITFKTWPRVWLGIINPSTPGTCSGTRVSIIWEMLSTKESLVISNKDDMPTDLSRKLYLWTK